MGKESVTVDFQANFLPQLFRSAVFIFSLMAVVYLFPISADAWVAFGMDFKNMQKNINGIARIFPQAIKPHFFHLRMS